MTHEPPASQSWRYFLSYARNDQPLVDKFDHEFSAALNVIPDHSFAKWRDVDALLPGDRWFDEIQKSLANSDFGVLLLSNHFLSSDFIRRHELPVLQSKTCIPVGLQQVVNSDAINSRLGGQQVFLLNQSRWFADCPKPQRVHFVNALANKILRVLSER